MYAIVDIETTGGGINHKITEIAIYIFDGNKIVDEFITLINPERSIPFFITNLTGISNEMVANAPKFYEVAKKIIEITANKIFVAHNVGFDYNFIRAEFKSLGYDYKRKNICTVKLSRTLIPSLPSYSLGNLCKEIGINITDRHRASGDAFATVLLFEKLLSLHGGKDDLFSGERLSKITKFNPQLDRQKVEDLPEETGVYYFYDQSGNLIYVGKSKNIYNRVLSHLNNGSVRAQNMRDRIADITFELTGSELLAYLLESEQIKMNLPHFNRAQRRTVFNTGIYLFEDENGYLNLRIANITSSAAEPIATFDSVSKARTFLENLIDKNVLCQKLCELYKSDSSCFHYSVKKCKGACIGEESPLMYNKRVRNALSDFQFEFDNFFIIDKGRTKNEKAVVKVKNGKYIGFGYIQPEFSPLIHENLHECIHKYSDNKDTQQIIIRFLKRKLYEKFIVY